jgi:hypothetical protein
VDIDLNALTLAALLTTVGATVVAAFVTGFVQVIKNLINIDGQEARVAALLAAIIVILLAVSAVQTAAMVIGVPLILAMLFGWYGVTRIAMSIHDDFTGAPRSLTNTSDTK